MSKTTKPEVGRSWNWVTVLGLAVGWLVSAGHVFGQGGAVDPTFEAGPAFTGVSKVAVQADGKVYLGGPFKTYGTTVVAGVLRLSADGKPDATFAIGAGLEGPFSGAVPPSVFALVPYQGGVLVGGTFEKASGQPRTNFVRYLANGSVDTAFAVRVDNPVMAVAVQPDGKVLIGGGFKNVNGTARNGLARLNANGTLDTGFNPTWGTIVGPSVRAIGVLPDGKILVGGGHLTLTGGLSVKAAVRLGADGTFDTTFQVPGVTALTESVGMVVPQSGGKVVVGGSFATLSGVARKGLARLNADGTVDTGWGGAGVGSGGAENVQALGLAPDGKLYVGGGFATLNGVGPGGIARLNADGTRDADFAKPAGSTSFNVSDLAVQADGKVIVVGGFTLGTTGDSVKSVLRLVPGGTVVPPTPPPVIDAGPGSIAAALNTVNVQMNVFATGTPPLAYQWYKDGVVLPLKTDRSLLISQLRETDVGNYWVVVSNAGGSVTSAVARVSLLAPARVVTPPSALTVAPGERATFSVVASGTEPIAYQWRKNGVNIPGATAATYAVAAASAADEGEYSVSVSNTSGGEVSAGARLTVRGAGPRITRQPAGVTVDVAEAGLSARVLAGRRLRLTVSGGLAPWVTNGTYEIAFTATGYTSPAGGALATASTGTYRVGAGTAPVATLVDFDGFFPGGVAARLTLVPGGIFEFNREGLVADQNGRWELLPAYVAPAGPTVSFSVEATGSGTLAYQWSRNSTPIAGATGAVLTLTGVTAADLGDYTVAVTDAAGTVTSAVARLGSAATEPAGQAPATYDELVNRLFLRTAPNGSQEAFRLLAGGVFDIPLGNGYRTNRVTYTRDGLPEGQARLTFRSTDVFSGRLSERVYDYNLVFTSGRAGLYDLDFTVTGVQGVQEFSGPFEISAGTNIVPRIVSQPTGGTVPAGTSLNLTVVALGLELSYQWMKDGVAISGATNRNYQPGPLTAAGVGKYSVTVTNPMGSVTSDVAAVELATVPVIVRQPTSMEISEGDSFRLTVEATGGGLTYDWLLNGRSVFRPEPTPDYVVTRATVSMAGTYTVRVSNQAGTVESRAVTVVVCSPGLDHTWEGRGWARVVGSGDPVPGAPNTFGPLASPFEPLFTVRDQTVQVVARGDDNVAGAAAVHRGLFRWRDGGLRTLVFTNTARPGGGFFDDVFYPTDEEGGIVNFASGPMYAWREGGVTEFVGRNTVAPGRAPLALIGTGSYARRGGRVVISSTVGTLEPFVMAGTGVYLHDGTTVSRIADDTTDLPGLLGGYGGRPSEDAINFDGETVVFSTVQPGVGGAGVFKANLAGVVTKLADSGDIFPGTVTNRYGNFGDVDVEGGWVFAVANDGPGRLNRVVVFDEGGAGRVVGNGDYLVAAGPRQVWFGTRNAIYRWTDGVTEVVISSGARLDCRQVSGFFDVEAHGEDVAIGVVFADGSRAIYFNVGAPTTGAPRILVQPEAATVAETLPVSFSVTATGAGPLRYQWRRNGAAIEGATGGVLNLVTTGAADGGAYDVVVSNGAGSVTSAAAALVLSAAPAVPAIQVQPVSTNLPVGSRALLSVGVSGARPMTFQWRHASTNLPGANGPSLEFTSVSGLDHGGYDLVASNASGAVTSRVASLVVLPLIVAQPANRTVAVGGVATFEVTATGYPGFRYFWFKDDAPLVGATNRVLEVPSVTAASAGVYSVTVIGLNGAATGGGVRSAGGVLTVSGGGEPPVGEIVLGAPTPVAGRIEFGVPTVSGRTYTVEFRSGLGDGAWATSETFTGDGSVRTVRVPTSGVSGFVRIATGP